jgi:leucyl-tRNA synthetase
MHTRSCTPRFACGPEGMSRSLIERYVTVSALLLAPITPHTCEHIWGTLLRRPGSVLRAGWPRAAEPDFIMQRAAQYIESECVCVCVCLCVRVCEGVVV